MPQISLLRGKEWYVRGVKEYAYNDNIQIVKTSDFKLGYLFDYESLEVSSLTDLCALFRDLGSRNDQAIRIHGIPRPEKAFSGGPFERNQKCFQEPEGGISLFNFDIDDWPCGTFDYAQPESGITAIRKALTDKGFGFLNAYDCVVLWTQSAWKTDHLRCHLYMLLDASIALKTLRSWATAVNRTRKERVIDGSVWVDIQPDYIGRRIVVPPLVDPLTEEQRVFFAKGDRAFLSRDILLQEINKAIALEKDSAGDGSRAAMEKGDTWQATIAKSGTPGLPEGEINAWGFRAAAQMVQEYGPMYIRSNMRDLSTDLHARAWEGIHRNAEGRGSESDANTYDVDRYRQYLRSACDRGFGGDCDQSVTAIITAINEAAETENLRSLLSKETLTACADVAKKRPSAWVEIQSEIKTKLRGKVSITEFRKLVKNRDPDHVKTGAGAPPDEGRVKLIRQVLAGFDWVCDDNNNRYIGRAVRDDSGFPEGYELRTLGDNLENVFYHIGAQQDETVTPHFGKSCLAYLLGSLHGGAPAAEKVKWVSRVVGKQQIRDADGVLWWCLGAKESLKIDPETGISHEINGDGDANQVLWHAQRKTRERIVADVAPAGSVNLLWKYILCHRDDRPQILGWLINCLTDANSQMILELIGPPGGAKSSAGSALRDLIEPVSANPFYYDPKERMTLIGQTRNDKWRTIRDNAVIFLDNLSWLDAETQNQYCIITTGICPKIRIMYSSVMEDVPIKRPMILTGINPMITSPDLLSRSVRTYFHPIIPDTALTETELPVHWERDKPVILRALADICLKVLRQGGNTVGRRGSYVGVMQAIYGDDAGAMQADRDYKRAQTDIVVTNSFCLVFTAFVLDAMKTRNVCTLTETPGAIHVNYRRWAESHWGEDLEVPLACGERVMVSITHQNSKINHFLPATPGGLGALLNKFTHELRNVCGIDVSESSKSNGVRVRNISRVVNVPTILKKSLM